MALILELQTEAFWQDITLSMIEDVRKRLRGLIKFITKQSATLVYSSFTDDIQDGQEVSLGDFSTGINLAQYRKKVEAFIRSHQDHITIAKLKMNKPLTAMDLSELERFVFESNEAESRERFEECFGTEQPLTVFIRSLVGLDRTAAKEAFGKFLDEGLYSSRQIRFVEMIIDHLTHAGTMDPGLLYEPPFTSAHHDGLDGIFPDTSGDEILAVVRDINNSANEISRVA